jgi:hypothetical protein
MTTRPQLLEMLYEQDAAIPQSGLPLAKQRHQYAESRHRWDQQVIDELDDNAVYEWRWDSEDQVFHAARREVAELTARQVQLAGQFASDIQTHLLSQPIELGESYQQDSDQWRVKYGFGWALRPTLEEQLASSAHALEASRDDVERIEEDLANRERHSPLDFLAQLGHSERPNLGKVNWQQEGF